MESVVPFLQLHDSELSFVQSICARCDARWFTSKVRCPRCGGDEIGTRSVGSAGVIASCTRVHRSERGVQTPFVSVIVDLDSGGRLRGTLIDAVENDAEMEGLLGRRARAVPLERPHGDASILAYAFELQ